MTEPVTRNTAGFAPSLCGAVVVLLGCSVGCDGPVTAAPPRARETQAYWEHFDQHSRFGTGVEALNWPAHPGPIPARAVYAVMGDLADGEEMRGRIISTMSGLRVDPELLNYAIQYAQARLAVAALVRGFVELAKEQEDLTGKPALAAPVLREFLQAGSPSGDGPLWEALQQHGLQTGRNVTSLRERVESLERRADGPRAEIARLRVREPELRAQLGRKYGAQFAPLGVFNGGWSTSPPTLLLTEKDIAGSLIGQTVGGLVGGWTFESPQEFLAVKVLSATNQSDVLAGREIQVQLRGLRTGNERNYRLDLTYGRLGTRWVLLRLHLVE